MAMSCHRFPQTAGWDPKTLVLSNLTILLGRHFFASQIHAADVDVWIQSLIEVVGPAGPEDLLGKAPPEAPLEAPTSPEVS